MSDNILDEAYDPRVDGALRAPGQARVRPRHAATLIIVRRDGPKPRLLMGRRNGGHAFMPGKWVFPGGRVDRADFTAPAAGELAGDVSAKLKQDQRHPSPALPRALALAAIRETFEETGLLVAKPAARRPGLGGWSGFLAQGAAPNAADLRYVGRAITPPYRPKRFDARFFMTDAQGLISLDRCADCGELDEIAWVDLEEALALDLPNITRFIVKEVGARLIDPQRPIPFTRQHRAKRLLSYI